MLNRAVATRYEEPANSLLGMVNLGPQIWTQFCPLPFSAKLRAVPQMQIAMIIANQALGGNAARAAPEFSTCDRPELIFI